MHTLWSLNWFVIYLGSLIKNLKIICWHLQKNLILFSNAITEKEADLGYILIQMLNEIEQTRCQLSRLRYFFPIFPISTCKILFLWNKLTQQCKMISFLHSTYMMIANAWLTKGTIFSEFSWPNFLNVLEYRQKKWHILGNVCWCQQKTADFSFFDCYHHAAFFGSNCVNFQLISAIKRNFTAISLNERYIKKWYFFPFFKFWSIKFLFCKIDSHNSTKF